MEETFSMEWNMERIFNMEWNMEWKIFGMEWKWNGRKLPLPLCLVFGCSSLFLCSFEAEFHTILH